jgi:fatty-acyl-CoA synthase
MTNLNYNPGEAYRYPLIIKKLLSTPLICSPDREIVYGDKSRYTYRGLNERIHRLAGSLETIGVKPGNTVAVMDYDSTRYLECFFAIPMMGAVLQTVNWRLSTNQISYTIRHAEADFIIINSDFLPILESIHGTLEMVKKVIVISETENHAVSRLSIDGEYEDLLQSARRSYDFPDFDENTKATTFYTTGTTGNPKGVYFSHRQLMLHTLSVAASFGAYHTSGRFRSDDVYMPLTPMFHVHAWGFPYVSTLLGSKQVYPGPYIPEKILKLIEEEKVTFSHCVPTLLQMILNCPMAKEVDLSNWKVGIGGSRLSKGLAKTAMDLGIEITSGFGMSETCPIVSNSAPNEEMLEWTKDDLLDVITTAGKPIALVELEVVGEDDNILPHDGVSVGEVVMRSPWLTESYYNEPEKAKDLWRNGWLHSGDLGYISPNGYLKITDRIKDVIKSGGEWISSLDLENTLSRHEAVQESVAIGIPDEKWGERPLMIVTLKPEFLGEVSQDDLKRFMEKHAADGGIPRYGIPDRFEFVADIPKTSVGKLDKKMLRKSYTE